MHSIQLATFGLEGLRQTTSDLPPCGDHDVRVRVRAVALNYRDLMTVLGIYNSKQPLPLIPCSDGAGEVIAIGAKVTRFQVGDRVMATFAQDWLDGAPRPDTMRSTRGGPLSGMLAEEVQVPEHGWVHIPDSYSYEEAATLPCAGLTAFSAFDLLGFSGTRGASSADAERWVLVQGTGGVSLFALQLAVARGFRVIITSKDDAKLLRAEAMGATFGINYRSDTDWGKKARELTGGAGVDCVIDVGGTGTLSQAMRAVRPGGGVAVIGVLGGSAPLPAQVVTQVLMNQVRLQGVFVGHRMGLSLLCEELVAHQIRPVIDKVFPFAQAKTAFEHLQAGAHFGKVLIRVD
jgi:NADPH:quinone reductase-like Zn-dependent oxidoreductase